MIYATNSNILVLAEDRPHTTKSGIAIPVTDKNNDIVKGVVVNMGPGKRDETVRSIQSDIEAGFTVYFPRFNATEILYSDKKYLIIDESYILAYEETESK